MTAEKGAQGHRDFRAVGAFAGLGGRKVRERDRGVMNCMGELGRRIYEVCRWM